MIESCSSRFSLWYELNARKAFIMLMDSPEDFKRKIQRGIKADTNCSASEIAQEVKCSHQLKNTIAVSQKSPAVLGSNLWYPKNI